MDFKFWFSDNNSLKYTKSNPWYFIWLINISTSLILVPFSIKIILPLLILFFIVAMLLFVKIIDGLTSKYSFFWHWLILTGELIRHIFVLRFCELSLLSKLRKFSSLVPSLEKINKILEAGRIAPTAKNLQPIKIYVVKDISNIKKIDKVTPCRYNAPIVLIICGDKDNSYVKGDYPIYQIDASIVATHIMLEATNVGVDNIWIENFDNEILKKRV